MRVGALPVAADRLAPAGELSGPQTMVVNALLLRAGSRAVLVDAGSGPSIACWPGGRDWLPRALAQAGVAPGDIELVVLTHLDFDHAGGLLAADGELVFPRARVAVLAEGPDAVRGIEPAGPLDHAPRLAAALERHGVLEGLADGDEPVPGVVLRALPGHRPGHAGVGVADDLLHLGDLFHHPVHVQQPGWHDAFDDDAALARRTRQTLLAECAASGIVSTGGHLPGRYGGRVVPAAAGFRWRQRRSR